MSSSPPLSRSKRLVFSLIALLLGLLVIFVAGEMVMRLFPKFVNDPPAPPPYNYRVPDKTYGWLVQEGYRHEGEMRDFKGNPYSLQISFGKNGFRKWGNPETTDRKRVLFLGDSYTACAQTSDDKLFYKILGDSLPIEVFAYSAAGYGNTQQYLVLEKYLDEVRPDLVVWQFCSNDFIDNYWELEKAAGYHVRIRRPYTLEDGSIAYHLAAEYPRNVKQYSYFLYFMLKRVAEARGTFDKPPTEPAEKWIAEQNLGYEPFARSVRMTDAVIKKMKKLLPPETRLLVFDADGFQPQYDQFKRLCAENGVPFADGLDAFVHRAEAAGECVRTDDGYHWNNRGNELTAAFLKPFLFQQLSL
jgi:lysophospholipase L1-like esterase